MRENHIPAATRSSNAARPDTGAPLPPLAPGAPGRPPQRKYQQQFGVVIVCPDEAAQRAVYEGLAGLARCTLRVVVT